MMKSASAEAGNTADEAMSSGVPQRASLGQDPIVDLGVDLLQHVRARSAGADGVDGDRGAEREGGPW